MERNKMVPTEIDEQWRPLPEEPSWAEAHWKHKAGISINHGSAGRDAFAAHFLNVAFDFAIPARWMLPGRGQFRARPDFVTHRQLVLMFSNLVDRLNVFKLSSFDFKYFVRFSVVVIG